MFFKKKKTDEELLEEMRRKRVLEEFTKMEPALLEFLHAALPIAERQNNMADQLLIGNYLESLADTLRLSKQMLMENSTFKRFQIQLDLAKAFAKHAVFSKQLTEHKNLVDGDCLFNLVSTFVDKAKEVSPGFVLHSQIRKG